MTPQRLANSTLRPAHILAVIALAVLAPVVTGAQQQVGYPPAKSPYEDIDYHQDFSLLLGDFRAQKDAAGVAPLGGPMYGLFYEWRAGGPAYLSGEFSHVDAQRYVIDTASSVKTRRTGPRADPLTSLDLTAALALSGFKTWHLLQPMVHGGVGLISDFHGADKGGFSIGTRFAFSWGAGVRYIPGGRWSLRADVNDRLYSISYPESYYHTPPGVSAPVLPANQSRTSWLNNPELTLGLQYQFSR